MTARHRNVPFVTIALIAINVAVFLATLFGPAAIMDRGELSPAQFFVGKQYYRAVTAMFLHADVGHIFNNMLLLGGLGVMLEPVLGHAWFALAYFLSGIGGQACSLIWKLIQREFLSASIGASGAVFGMFGILLAVALLLRHHVATVSWKRVLVVSVYSIYTGIRSSGIDNAAHIGGFATGIVIGVVFCLVQLVKNKKSFEGE